MTPSGMITSRAAPTRRPAPKIAIRFIMRYDVCILVGRNPKRKVKKNIPRHSMITENEFQTLVFVI